MNLKEILKGKFGASLVALLCLASGQTTVFGGNITLEGQNKGNTNTWSSGNLQNWAELDYIPCRVHFTSSQGNNQTITVSFERINGGVPGVQDLYNFTASSNVVFTSLPVLSAPPSANIWSYSFTINILDGQPANVWFLARLAAGAHLNVGSSLALSGKPSSMGNLQISKPGVGPGSPDLAVVKTGSTSACQGGMVSYTLTYTNKAPVDNSVGVQISDILPVWLTVDPSSLGTNAHAVGNTIFWDLPNLAAHASGQFTFQAQASYQTPFGLVLTNFAQILSSENDANMLDNSSRWLTTANCACTNASVATPPASVAVCPGGSANFTVTAGGPGPFTYQWRKDGNDIPGATGTSYSIGSVSSGDAGSYSAAVTNLCGGVISSAATLTLNQFVTISTAPADQTVCAGSTANFSVSASGTGLTYQWYKGASALAGKTISSLTLSNVTVADAGTYSVVVSGTCADSVTNSANLTVNQNVIVSSAPVSLTNCAGTTASFSVTATGAGLSYQWYKGAGILAGQTGSILTLNNITASDAAVYRVVVSGTCGAAVTNSVSLTVNALLSVSILPANATNCAGTTANFTVAATGTGLSYQWFKDGNVMAGQTGSSLTLNNVSSADVGVYTAVAGGICGNAATNSATLTVNDNVSVSSGPADLTKCPGNNATFSVSASGTSLSYQWYKGASTLSGQTDSSLTLNNVSSTDAGSYSVTVSGVCGSATRSATLSVNDEVTVSSAPVSLTNCPGTSASFNVSATGTSLNYQWYKGTNALSSETNNSLTLTNVSAADASDYSIVVSGACGNAVTNTATLTVNENLTIANGPADLTVCVGDSASFSIGATGTSLAYQWLHDGSAIPGATDNMLNLASAQASDAGRYDVIVSGACGAAQTNGAMLVVNMPVTISGNLVDQIVCAASSVSFSVNATGSGLTYQWFHDGTPIAGATSTSVNIAAAQVADSGRYDVIVSGTCGAPEAAGANLVVNSPVAVSGQINDQTVCAAGNVSFSVSATGTGLGYQWFKGAAALPGKTGSSLTLNNVSASDAGGYSVTVSGTCGNSITSSATLTVNENVAVVNGPANVTTCPATSANFSVSATGTGLSFQWFKGASALVGQTGSSLTLNNVSASDAGSYSVTVSGVCGNSITSSATLTVNENVAVTTGPANVTTCPGTSANFSVNATGTGLTYQWFKGASALVGQTGSSLTLNNVSASDAGIYRVTVSGICNSSTTSSANLTVNENVAVANGPANVTTCPGTSASFSVNATGTGLTYQWFKGTSALVGQTGSSLTLNNVSASDAGSYSVTVSGTCDNSITSSANLTVNENVAVATGPANVTTCPGTSANFSVNATGTGLSFQWFKGAAALPGKTGSSLTLNNVSASDAGGYSVTVSGTCGNSITSSATLTVNENVAVVNGPANVTTCPATSANFSVSATGTGLSFQWFKGASALVGQTGSSLTLNNVSASDAGSYSVTVSGVCGNSITSSATLTVNENVAVTTGPANVTTCPGTSANFSVNATGTGLTYQWFKGASALVGQTGSSLTLNNVSASDAGIYRVTVSGICNSSTTSSANLTVNENVAVANGPANVTTCPGTSANFSVNATGTGQTYQWFKGTSALVGQTGSSLTLNNVSASDAGSYSVTVSGTCGNSITSSATLTVNENVAVATGPANVTTCPGTSANFSVNATGTGLTYQWYKSISVIAGQTSSSALAGETAATLALNNLSATDAGNYSVVVRGACGASITNTATLTVNEKVAVAGGPADQTVCAGDSAAFSVNASGTGLAYQWLHNGTALAGATSSGLNLANAKAADAGRYDVVVSGVCGAAQTNGATLVVNARVVVMAGPAAQTVCAGGSANFNVSATGTGLSYQWYKGIVALGGQTGSTLSLSNVQAADAGDYSVVVSGTCGGVVTSSARLTVNENLVVGSGPVSLTNCPGTAANFSVAATGTGLGYQWFKGASALTGQTGSSLSLNNVSAADAGSYSVTVSGVCGSPVTQSANLTVNQNVVVSSGPANVTTCPGISASFSVSATGTGLNYQWSKDGNVLAGQTGSGLTLNNVSASDAGSYSVTVSGVCGSSITSSAMLTVNDNVVVSSTPVSVTNCPGTSATFGVIAAGTGLGYQWYKGTNELTGAASSSLRLTNVSASDAGAYSVVVSGTCGTPVTNSAMLVVNENLVVASGPTDVTVCAGASASFSVSATGTGLAYQWLHNGMPVVGATSGSLNLSNVSASDAGSYSVTVSGTCGAAQTVGANLVVNAQVMVLSGPTAQIVCPGNSASFNIWATGTGLTYQWFKGAAALPGQTGSSLVLNNVSAADTGSYSVVVNGVCGSSVSSPATLTVNENVAVATGPANVTTCPGTSANFSVNATGTGLTYQWFKGASALVGQTGSSLTLNNVSASDAGSYSVTVSGVCGNSITSSATLTVNENVAVTTGPANVTTCPGTSANFSVNATGTGLTYQWFKGASALVGQTGSSLTLNNVSASDAGIYRVTVSGICNSSTTSSANLTVNENVAVANGPANVTTCPGTSASFSVNATGTGLTYQWFKGTSALVGQTGSSLTLNNVSASDAGSYSVTVSGTCDNSITSSANLTVNENVAVATGPANVTTCPGTSANFSVNATGTGLTYQWFKGAAALPGQSASSLTLNNVSASDAGSYSVTVSGTCGNGITSSANLMVNENVAVSSAPVSLTNCAGSTATFSVAATGTGLSYQWYKNNSVLLVQTGTSLVLNNVSDVDVATYMVVVSGGCGSSITNSATLMLNQSVSVASGPTSVTNCPGTSASFSVAAAGTGLSYQWFKGITVVAGQTSSSALAGQTAPTLTLNNLNTTDGGTYSVVVSGTCGASITNTATLTLNQAVTVSSAPASVTNCPGTSANFSVAATGSGLSYQWYKGANALAGQTANTLTLNNVTASDAGSYSVTVSGACGNSVASSANLTVNSTVTSSALTSLSICPGQTASFATVATGTSPITCQWQKNGVLIAGQTNQSLTLNNVSAADSGTYTVLVGSGCGNTTQSATLTVNTNASASALTSLTRNPGSSATFSTVATGTGPFTYAWKKNGTVLPGRTTSSITLTNLTSADAGSYTVEVSGTCSMASQTAALIVNAPPTVSIVNPTNGATFVFPQGVPILVNANDIDGTITKVEIFQGNTRLADLYVAPYAFFWTNVPVGNYQLTARATDNSGLSATSSVVNITVLDHAPIAAGPIVLNRQNGLFEQTVTISNPTAYTFEAVRLWIQNLTAETKVWNATGTNNGVPYIDYNQPIAAGGSVSLLIQYYVPSRITPVPTLVPQVLGSDYGQSKYAVAAPMIDSCTRLADGSIALQFEANANATYAVQYCSRLGGVWKTANAVLTGTGGTAQFVDSGAPVTESQPSTQTSRFYRLAVISQ